MRRTLALATIVVAAGLAAAGCGGGDEESSATTAATEWADGFCTAFTSWTDDLQQIGDELTASPSQDALGQAADDVKTATDTLLDDLRALGTPDTESGQEVKDSIDQLSTTLESDLDEVESAV
jgi:hypothetical protein